MYNYDNEYTQPGYETNYEFNPEYESDYEMENFEDESGNGYEMNPQFNMEQNYEAESQYEDEWPRNVVVRDHRTFRPSTPRPIVVPTRPGLGYYRRPYYRPGSPYRPGSVYRRYPYRRPNLINRNYYNIPGRFPWYNRYNRYPGSVINTGVSNINQDQGSNFNQNQSSNFNQDQGSQYPQSPGMSGQPSANSGGGIPSYLLDTIQNLSRQIAATNSNVDALQKSIAGGNKPDTATAPPPPDNSPAPGAGSPPPGQGTGGEHEMEDYEYMGNEMEDYEYNTENEMMNYEDENNEMMEMELATELLATNNEMELDHFLEGLVGGGLKKLLHAVVKKALPVAGAAAGAFFGGPLGAKVGEKIGSAASGVFELELEGLSNEDQEFEVARAIIRLANDAAGELAEGNSTGDPNDDARNALIQSAMRNAPGLLVRKRRSYHHNGDGYRGHWHRRGNKIVIENAF